MANEYEPGPPDSFHPVLELLRGGNPTEVAIQAGISVKELFRRRDSFLQIQAWKARQDDGVPQKIGRNDACPCGSGRKYKKCCLQKNEEMLGLTNLEEIRSGTHQKQEMEQKEKRIREGYSLEGVGFGLFEEMVAQVFLKVSSERKCGEERPICRMYGEQTIGIHFFHDPHTGSVHINRIIHQAMKNTMINGDLAGTIRVMEAIVVSGQNSSLHWVGN